MTLVRSRGFAWLAFAAMLSLAVLPTLGRLGGTMPAHPGMATSTAMSMADRHAMHAQVPGMAMEMAMHGHMHAVDGGARPTHPLPAPGEHEGHDCTYCLLLSGLVASAALHWMPPATFAATHLQARAVVDRRVAAPVPALGAQGPPSFEPG